MWAANLVTRIEDRKLNEDNIRTASEDQRQQLRCLHSLLGRLFDDIDSCEGMFRSGGGFDRRIPALNAPEYLPRLSPVETGDEEALNPMKSEGDACTGELDNGRLREYVMNVIVEAVRSTRESGDGAKEYAAVNNLKAVKAREVEKAAEIARLNTIVSGMQTVVSQCDYLGEALSRANAELAETRGRNRELEASLADCEEAIQEAVTKKDEAWRPTPHCTTRSSSDGFRVRC